MIYIYIFKSGLSFEPVGGNTALLDRFRMPLKKKKKI